MEANDRKAMREALEKVNEAYDILSRPCITAEEARQACREARGVLIPALSKPPRNCDVGTANEQQKRFDRFCARQCCMSGEDYVNKCPLDPDACEFDWAQMPYEEGCNYETE